MTQNNCCYLLSNNYWSCCAARNTIFGHSSCFITSGSVRTDFLQVSDFMSVNLIRKGLQ